MGNIFMREGAWQSTDRGSGEMAYFYFINRIEEVPNPVLKFQFPDPATGIRIAFILVPGSAFSLFVPRFLQPGEIVEFQLMLRMPFKEKTAHDRDK